MVSLSTVLMQQLVAKQLGSFDIRFPPRVCSQPRKRLQSFSPSVGIWQVFEYPRYLHLLSLSFGCFPLPISNLMLSLSLQHASSRIIHRFSSSLQLCAALKFSLAKNNKRRVEAAGARAQ